MEKKQQIKFDKRNYRKHSKKNKALIKKSLEELGAGRSIVIDNEGEIIAGNGVYEQAQKLGIKTKIVETDGSELVVVKRTDLATDDDKRKKLALADNAASDTSEWADDLLREDWTKEALAEFGVELPDVEMQTETEEAQEDDFDEDKDKVETVCKKGDIWQLGNHRLMCGNSTNAEEVARLMDGQTADISFSSPPYNAGFGKCITKDNGRSKYRTGDDNMKRDEYAQFLCAYLSASQIYSKYTFCNIQMLSNNKLALFDAINENIRTLGDVIIWDKTRAQPQLAERVLNSQFEFVLCFHESGTRAIGTRKFHGTLANIIHIPPKHNDYSKEHNAVFPVELPAHFISNFSTNSVLDLFGGTGTTMIAAEQLDRKCYMMELDPHYCDVIIARWEKLTGQKAIKII